MVILCVVFSANMKQAMCQHIQVLPYGDDVPAELFSSPHVYFIGTQHKSFEKLEFPDGSVVIDPFRYIPKRNHVEIIGLGTA